jgi:hypothetical protein
MSTRPNFHVKSQCYLKNVSYHSSERSKSNFLFILNDKQSHNFWVISQRTFRTNENSVSWSESEQELCAIFAECTSSSHYPQTHTRHIKTSTKCRWLFHFDNQPVSCHFPPQPSRKVNEKRNWSEKWKVLEIMGRTHAEHFTRHKVTLDMMINVPATKIGLLLLHAFVNNNCALFCFQTTTFPINNTPSDDKWSGDRQNMLLALEMDWKYFDWQCEWPENYFLRPLLLIRQ